MSSILLKISSCHLCEVPYVVIAGGGSGHEPAHAGYTGRGMLSASVAGDVFASPSASQVCTAIQLAITAARVNKQDDIHPEVLLVINNYTGDRLNFGLAAEKARSSFPDLRIDNVVVADDVSLLSRPSLVGPRGLAGNILVCKVLGAAAETGASLDDIKPLGDAIVAELASIGVGLEHCHIPGRQVVENNVPKGQCEIGLGLHNEPGARVTALTDPSGLISEMLTLVLGCGEVRGSGEFIKQNDSVVLFVNNLGGISTLEMGAVVDETLSQLSKLHIRPVRVLSSYFMTSLNAPGFSLSLLNLSAVERKLEKVSPFCSVSTLLGLIDMPTDTVSWPGGRLNWPSKPVDKVDQEDVTNIIHESLPIASNVTEGKDNSESTEERWKQLTGFSGTQIERGIRQACKAVSDAEPYLTQFDTEMGDGDCGETFKSGAKAILSALDSRELRINSTSPARVVEKIANILEDSMGGTSGALFGIFLTALATALRQLDEGKTKVNPLSSALNSLATYTPARIGDRTLVDALSPFCEVICKGETLDSAVKEARKGAESTREMEPRLGRAVYVRGGESVQSRPPDPGAWGVMILLEGFLEGVQQA